MLTPNQNCATCMTMSSDSPELQFARLMRDYVRTVRSMAADVQVAGLALAEERRLAKKVEELEQRETQPELELAKAS